MKGECLEVLQGDVGSGKTIVAMLAIANTIIESKYQTAITWDLLKY